MSKIEPNLGLKFPAARLLVKQALEIAVSSHNGTVSFAQCCRDNQKQLLAIAIPQLFAIALYLISLAFSPTSVLIGGNSIAAFLLLCSSVINVSIFYTLKRTESMEIVCQLKEILMEYIDLSDMSQCSSMTAECPVLSQGHSQISIINTLRNGKWTKIPSLLLAEGDIIALMGGDITPGKVYEMPVGVGTSDKPSDGFDPHSECPSPLSHQSLPLLQQPPQEHKIIPSGEKILLRNKKPPSKRQSLMMLQQQQQLLHQLSSGATSPATDLHPHHSQHPSGEVTFAPGTAVGAGFESHRHRGYDPNGVKKSDRHRSLASDNVEILRLTGDIRCFVMAETPIQSFVQSIVTKPDSDRPCDSSFIRKLFLEAWRQGLYFFAALLLIILISGIVRTSLLNCPDRVLTHSLLIPIANLVIVFTPVSMPLLLLVGEALAMADILSSTEILLYKDSTAKKAASAALKDGTIATATTAVASASSVMSPGAGLNAKSRSKELPDYLQDSEQNDDNNEFRDEDLDERAEDIAEDIEEKITFQRYLAYFWRVLYKRLGFTTPYSLKNRRNRQRGAPTTATPASVLNEPEYLPIPFIRSRLCENLGAISMVCLVDDDVVCENFSVTEEVFLLADSDGDRSTNNTSKSKHILEVALPSEPNKASLLESKGTVLDLHANPQATGSRFESPYWWRYLPSLKPIGLNASLTYSMNSNALSAQYNKSYDLDTVKPSANHTRELEKALVGHIRKTLPLESLRELAEEIGCGSSDMEFFNCMLELNVLAPGLENAHLLEDTHTWGQEESRRRGSLMPQVRGTVFKDHRDNSHQMMTIGDPSLILNYCREYWDGTAIDALNNQGRKEVLNVYDRWKLEDFDVVAFGYSPIPQCAFNSIVDLSIYHEAKKQKQESEGLMGRPSPEISADKHCTLFFVDPSTPAQLTSFDTAKKTKVEIRVDQSPGRGKSGKDWKAAYVRSKSEDMHRKKKHRRSISDPSLNATHESNLEEMMSQAVMMAADCPAIVEGENENNSPVQQQHQQQMQTQNNHSTSLAGIVSRSRAGSNDSTMEGKSRMLIKSASLDAALDSLAEDAEEAANAAAAAEAMASVTAAALAAAAAAGGGGEGMLDSADTVEGVHTSVHYEAEPEPQLHDEGQPEGELLNVESAEELERMQLSIEPSIHSTGMTEKLPGGISSAARQNRRNNMRQLWSLLRQQVFLGMTASSVPVRPDVPNTMEDLSSAGVRFVYFSPRNMKRSKPVAEKIGLAFDWNCAISLRDLDDQQHDPHRHISNYADWDVLARMPHGVEAIKRHLKEVDNVPLLVSLYTDATPTTTEKMVEVFREYGETVLTIGSGYKSHNYAIYEMSDVATSVYNLPGLGSHLYSSENVIVDMFPLSSDSTLNRADVLLSFRLIGLGTTNLLQTPYNHPTTIGDANAVVERTFMGQLKLPMLLESIHKGRSVLLSCVQSIGFLIISLVAIGGWIVICNVLPMSIPPTIPASLAVVFVFLYLPCIALLIMQAAAPAGVMKHTPRKRNFTVRPRDRTRFMRYLLVRSAFVALSVFLVGWFTLASCLKGHITVWHSLIRFHDVSCDRKGAAAVLLVQDMMSIQALLSIMSQSTTLLERGQTLSKFFPRLSMNPEFMVGCLAILCVHIILMVVRNYCRMAVDENAFRYSSLDFIVWILMCVLPFIGILVGSLVNYFDKVHYSRYLQFLRLEFDTRLGSVIMFVEFQRFLHIALESTTYSMNVHCWTLMYFLGWSRLSTIFLLSMLSGMLRCGKSTRSSCIAKRQTFQRFPGDSNTLKRALSAATQVKNDKSKKKVEDVYGKTLLLPTTTFAMKANPSKREPELQKFWKDIKIYEKLRDSNPGEKFILHDGPPYANGDLHIGHALNKVLKDIINKYQSLKGRKVSFVPGWDCHGLPIELKVLQSMKAKDRQKLTPVELRKTATEFAQATMASQREGFKRFGVWGSWDQPYLTMQPAYEAAQVKVFGEMVEKGHIYRGKRPVNWSPSSRTALAEAELEYPENHVSRSVYVGFPASQLSPALQCIAGADTVASSGVRVAVWTTTPWTLPANAAVAVHAEIDYCLASHPSLAYKYLLAKELVPTFAAKLGIDEACSPPALKVSASVKGSDLVGTLYRHPLYEGRESPVVLGGEYINTQSGTGLVHTAPGHGAEDYVTGLKHSLPLLSPVDDAGCFTEEAGPAFAGLDVLGEGNEAVIAALQACGALIREEPYPHKYPYDWRTKQPTLCRLTEQWFASVEAFRSRALEAIEAVEWIPSQGGAKLSSMVRDRADWCISRQRVWGVPIPVFYHRETRQPLMTKESIAHIESVFRERGSDAWWELSVAELLPEGPLRDQADQYDRGTDTMDVWFDSGTSWAGVVQDRSDLGSLPADLYLEGTDQHRGWFQSSLLTSVATNGRAPFKTVLTHGFVVDEKGMKMSKSVGNVVNPLTVINGGANVNTEPAYGADTLRLWAASCNYEHESRIGPSVMAIAAEVFRKLRNTMRFLLGSLADFDPASHEVPYSQLPAVDKHTLGKLSQIIQSMEQGYQTYNFTRVVRTLHDYVVIDLSADYFVQCRDRLYVSSREDSLRRRSCQTVLYYMLEQLLSALAPILPHLAEDVWSSVPYAGKNNERKVKSVFERGWISESFPLVDDLRWEHLSKVKKDVTGCLARAREIKAMDSLLEARVVLHSTDAETQRLMRDLAGDKTLQAAPTATNGVDDLRFLFCTSQVDVVESEAELLQQCPDFHAVASETVSGVSVGVTKARGRKCERCWLYCPSVGSDAVHSVVCSRCAHVLKVDKHCV